MTVLNLHESFIACALFIYTSLTDITLQQIKDSMCFKEYCLWIKDTMFQFIPIFKLNCWILLFLNSICLGYVSLKALQRLCGGSAEALRRLCGCFASDAECLFRDVLPLDDCPGKLFTRYILLTNTVIGIAIFVSYCIGVPLYEVVRLCRVRQIISPKFPALLGLTENQVGHLLQNSPLNSSLRSTDCRQIHLQAAAISLSPDARA